MEIKSTKEIAAQRITGLIYGAPGIGKTSLAKTVEGKVLIVSAESGLLCLAGSDIDTVEVYTWEDLFAIVKFLDTEEAKQKYQWIFLDSLTELSQRLIELLKKQYTDPKMAMKMWGDYSDRIIALIKKFRDFKPYNVIFTALEKHEKDEMNRRFTSVDMSGKASEKIPGLFDLVFYMTLAEDDEGNKQRVLFTESGKNFIAKDRSGKLTKPFVNADLQAVYEAIIGV